MFSRKRKIKKADSNNRLNLIMAVIFLMAGAAIFQLIKLQVWQYDLYSVLASDQHQAYNKLAPERGKIFIQDNIKGDDSKLYPIATNKDFALLYAIPSKVKDPQTVAEKLYEVFDKENVELEVDELLDDEEYFAEQTEKELSITGQKNIEEFKKIKRELEIEWRQKNVIDEYVKKISKKNDPYEPLQNKVDQEKLKAITDMEFLGIDYIYQKHRYYPENNIGAQLTGFVGFSGDDKQGRYGLEGFFDEELTGKQGTIQAERAADGGLTIVNDREYQKALDGSDLILTINRSIQFTACQKLNEVALRHGADSGSVVVMDPTTGGILAMCSWPDYDPNAYNEVEDINVFNNPVIFEQYEPGSIFKVFTMAAGLDQGVIQPDSTYVDHGQIMIEGWPKPIKNSDYETYGGHGRVDMVTVLEESLNTGSIYVMEKVGPTIFADYVKQFAFGEKTGIELETEGISNITNLKRNRIRPVEAATASFGQGITATPIQLVTAFSAIANGGILMKPYVVDKIISPTGNTAKTQPQSIRRVISEKAALLVSGMMVKVVEGGHAKLAAVDGYFVGGKTGTAQVFDKEKGGYQEDYTIHTFVGFAPAEDPRFVMLVKLDNPKDIRFAASSAAPLFGEIADFILNYFQVAKER